METEAGRGRKVESVLCVGLKVTERYHRGENPRRTKSFG
jgi:hypothetical protein